jgi:hypothetical protein
VSLIRQPRVAFAHLNLRRNPFGTLTPEEQARLAVVPSLDAVIARLGGSGRFAIQFTGDKGRGKSTHLRVLQHALPHAAYCFFPEQGPAPIIPATGVLLLDELQRMPLRARTRLFRSGRVLGISSHEDHTAELDAAGYVVEHWRLGGPDVATLLILIAQRIEGFRRAPGAVPRVTTAAIERLHARHQGDVRALLDELYDVFQALEAPGDVEM